MASESSKTAKILLFPEPRDVDTERAMLGCIMLRNNVYEQVNSFLRWEHFSEPLFQRIYDTMEKLIRAGKDANPTTLGPLFASDAGLVELGGYPYLVDLIIFPISINDASSYARTIVDLAKRREITDIGQDLVKAATDLPADLTTISLVEQASAALLDLDLRAAQQETIRGGPAAHLALEKAWAASRSEKTPGLSLGLDDIDAALGGAHAGDMIVLAGRPGMGKSAVGCGIARSVALTGGGVLYVSCEMTMEQLGRRLISDQTKDLGFVVPYQLLRAGRIDAAQYEVCQRAQAQIADIPLIIDDRRKPPLPQIIASAKRAARRFEAEGQELKLIVVDHMRLVAAPREYKGNRVSEVTEVSGELKALARDLGVPIITCSQLNRDLEGRDVKDKRPTLRDLRESGAIEQDADIVMLLYREEYYRLMKRPTDRYSAAFQEWEPDYLACKNKLDVIIAKNREGEPCTVTLHCDMSVSAIRNWRGYA